MDNDYYFLGNLKFLGGEDSGEPFMIGIAVDGSQVVLLSSNDNTSHTISVVAKKKFYFTKIIEYNALTTDDLPYFDGIIHHNMGVTPDIALITFETLEVVRDGPVELNGLAGTMEAVSSRFAKATGRDTVMTLICLNGSNGSAPFTGDNGLETNKTMSFIGGICNGTTSTIKVHASMVHKDAKYRLHLYGGLRLE